MNAEAIARITHEANTAYCREVGHDALPHWDDLDESYRASTVNGVHAALRGETPEALHTSWCVERFAAGWVYAPVLDRVNKRHNCLVPYAMLPADQRRKDALFIAVVQACKD